jgi:uncharacterized membrane protein
MAAKKKISTADLKKLLKEAHKLDPMKPIPKNVSARMDATIAKLAAAEKASQKKTTVTRGRGGRGGRGGGAGGAFLENLK